MSELSLAPTLTSTFASTFTLSSLMAFAFLLGMKHGFDADHLASIDGLARLQSRQGRFGLARLSGMLFSSGHGLVVLAAAGLLGRYGIAQLPQWLEPIGTWVSIIFLSSIGIVNLRQALRPGKTPTMPPIANWIMQLPLPQGVIGNLLVGAMFAFSLDAMTVAAWFNLAGSTHGGASTTLILALCFIFGMIVTDTINGLLVAKLITRSERFVRRAGRLFSILVASSALAVAGFGAAKLSSAVISAWADGRELMTGALVLGAILVCYLLARRSNRTSLRALESSCHPSM